MDIKINSMENEHCAQKYGEMQRGDSSENWSLCSEKCLGKILVLNNFGINLY